jgi:hypothetical protein
MFQIGKTRMLQITFQKTPHTRQERQIAGLAIALPQSGENTNDFGVPLRT